MFVPGKVVISQQPREQTIHRNVQRFRGGLVFKAHRLCVSLNSRLESNKEEEEGSSSRLEGHRAPGEMLSRSDLADSRCRANMTHKNVKALVFR